MKTQVNFDALGGGGGKFDKIVFDGVAGGNMSNPSNAFDGNTATKSFSSGENVGVLTYKFNSPKACCVFGFRGNTDSPTLTPTQIVIKGSTDNGVTFTTIGTLSSIPNDTVMKYFINTDPSSYSFYQFECSPRDGGFGVGYYAQLSEVEMYGY